MNSFVRHTFWALMMVAMVTSMALIGCGSNSNGGPAPVVVNPAVPTPVGPYQAGTSGRFMATNLQIVSAGTFKLFLKDYQQCSLPSLFGNGGAANCNAYTGDGYLELTIYGTSQATVVVGGGAKSPWSANSTWSTNMHVRPTFQVNIGTLANGNLTGVGPYGFRFTTSGAPSTSYQIPVELEYNGAVFARGILIAQ